MKNSETENFGSYYNILDKLEVTNNPSLIERAKLAIAKVSRKLQALHQKAMPENPMVSKQAVTSPVESPTERPSMRRR